MDIHKLAAPFPPDCVSWRVGSTTKNKDKGLALAYIDARDVMERLDAVCGPENWQDRYEFHGSRTVCYLSIRIGDEWITKADGAGDSDVEAEKGSISDALKRAAVKWGIGRYLYDMPSPWVEIEAFGRSFRIAKHEQDRLAKIAGGAKAAPAPAPRVTSGPQQDTPFDDGEGTHGKSPSTIAETLCQALALARTPQELMQWKEDNRPAVTALPKQFKAKVVNVFDMHMERLETEAGREAAE